jgi:hypothetical protein
MESGHYLDLAIEVVVTQLQRIECVNCWEDGIEIFRLVLLPSQK